MHLVHGIKWISEACSYTKDGPQVILTTREAAALLTLSPSMLQRYRVKGGGPRYLQIGGTLR